MKAEGAASLRDVPSVTVETSGSPVTLTGEQVFFVSYAHNWCTVRTPQYVQRQINTDPHSPAEWRVNGPLRNTPMFADAFGCAVGGDFMAPGGGERCTVW